MTALALAAWAVAVAAAFQVPIRYSARLERRRDSARYFGHGITS